PAPRARKVACRGVTPYHGAAPKTEDYQKTDEGVNADQTCTGPGGRSRRLIPFFPPRRLLNVPLSETQPCRRLRFRARVLPRHRGYWPETLCPSSRKVICRRLDFRARANEHSREGLAVLHRRREERDAAKLRQLVGGGHGTLPRLTDDHQLGESWV